VSAIARPFLHLPVELRGPGRVDPGEPLIEAHEQEMVGAVAGTAQHGVAESGVQARRGRDEDDSQRHLHDDERVTDPLPRAGCARRALMTATPYAMSPAV
jgi:hypothetical protein